MIDAKRMADKLISFQTFQRIQRNRQGRIRVKLSRRAAKRQDEILEEEEEQHQQQQQRQRQLQSKHQQTGEGDEDIDIVGDGNKANDSHSSSTAAESVAGARDHVYGPQQFTEADVLAAVSQNEENGVKKEVPDEDDSNEGKENEHVNAKEEEEDLEELKAKLKALEENNKCSKCLVSESATSQDAWFELSFHLNRNPCAIRSSTWLAGTFSAKSVGSSHW